MGLSRIRDTLKRNGLRLSRELGQSFLVEDALADRLAQLAGVERGDAVIEVGTGLGSLTRALARRAAPSFPDDAARSQKHASGRS